MILFSSKEDYFSPCNDNNKQSTSIIKSRIELMKAGFQSL